MQAIRISKLVINIGTGNEERHTDAAKKLITLITSRTPVDELSRKRNPSFKITKGQKIGAMVTVRGEEIKKLLPRLLDATDNRIKDSSITPNSLSFGIKEYIDIRGIKYDPAIGMLGMNVNLSFRRMGARVEYRKRGAARIPDHHRIIDRDAIKSFMEKEFGVNVAEG